MAIQKINLGTEPLGEGGDTYRSANTKINENFSNTEHAASRLVGKSNSNLVQVSDVAEIARSKAPTNIVLPDSELDLSALPLGSIYRVDSTHPSHPSEIPKRTTGIQIATFALSGDLSYTQHVQIAYHLRDDIFWYRKRKMGGGSNDYGDWYKIYTSGNTTKEEGTGYLVASSPVLKMQHDSFEKVHEAEQLDIDIKHIKTGVYEITGTTGLRENDGWNLKPPKDVNGNVLCICEASESNGVITLKTYKKKFDFETVSIVADYEQPTDIPEGAVVMLRFNDLPQETLDEDYSV